MGKYLGKTGVGKLWERIKSTFATRGYIDNADLDSINGEGFSIANTNAQALTERHYPIGEAGCLIHCNSVNSRSNQIYGTYESNRWFARGPGGGNVRTRWREFLFTDSYGGLLGTVHGSLVSNNIDGKGGLHFGDIDSSYHDDHITIGWVTVEKETGSEGYEEGYVAKNIYAATATTAGVMSAADKRLLDNNYMFHILIPKSVNITYEENFKDLSGGIMINGVPKASGSAEYARLESELMKLFEPIGWDNAPYGALDRVVIERIDSEDAHYVYRYEGLDADGWALFYNRISTKENRYYLYHDGTDLLIGR